MEALRNDFKIGMLLRNQVVPRAVLYITGEAADDEDEDKDEEDEEEDKVSGDIKC
jgi:hypothetical protein